MKTPVKIQYFIAVAAFLAAVGFGIAGSSPSLPSWQRSALVLQDSLSRLRDRYMTLCYIS